MTIVEFIGGRTAKVLDGVITSDDEVLEALLQPWAEPPPGYHTSLDNAIGDEIAAALGGKVTKRSRDPEPLDPEADY